MAWKIGMVLVSICLFLTACTGSGQRVMPVTGDGEKVSQQGRGRVPSAAAPGVPPTDALANADKILNQAKAAITALNWVGTRV